MAERINKVSLIIGRRGCGKTTFTKSIINTVYAQKKVLIVDTLEHPSYKHLGSIQPYQIKYWKKGHKKMKIGADVDNDLQAVYSNLKNAGVFFEDCTKYVNQRLPYHLKQYILDTKQLNIDLFFLYHSFANVPPDLFRYADIITIFKTNENLLSSKNKISNFDVCFSAHKEVMVSSSNYKNITVAVN